MESIVIPIHDDLSPNSEVTLVLLVGKNRHNHALHMQTYSVN